MPIDKRKLRDDCDEETTRAAKLLASQRWNGYTPEEMSEHGKLMRSRVLKKTGRKPKKRENTT